LLLTIGHSYVVTEYLRLAHEMAVQGKGRWEVTAIAPATFRGDLGPLRAEAAAGEAGALRTVPVRLNRSMHLMRYGKLDEAMTGRWDVVHAWEEPYIAAGAQIAAAVPDRARFVVSSFQNIAKTYPWPLSSFESATMARADGWIAFGQTVHETLAPRRGYEGKPSIVIPPGVDMTAFRPDAAAAAATRARLEWDEGVPIAGYLGRFEPQKGIETLISALERCRTPWRALFVGGGSLEPLLREFARRHPAKVRIATGVAHRDVPAWLSAMALLCAPSVTTRTWREQFGRMLIEAMACGVPVAGSDSGEIPHVIGPAGLVLPERDVDAWHRMLDAVLPDAAERARLGAAGRERANAAFSWPIVARAHLAWFEELAP
jgi:glycosyltransferase involved in cell wall biosynthesis